MALTPCDTAVLAYPPRRELVREPDTADRSYLAPYAAELLIDPCTDA